MSTFVNTAIIIMLREDHLYNVPDDRVGRVSNTILSFSLIVMTVFSFVAGYFFDLVGRKFTVCFATIFAGGIFAWIPHTIPNVAYLIFVRCLLGIAFGTMGSHPFINDYVKKGTRGKAVAIGSTG